MFSSKKARIKLVTVFLLLTASVTFVFAQDQPWAVPRQTETMYTTTRVNLRSGPSTDSEILHTLKRGESVEFQSIFNMEWSSVVFNDTRGFVSSEFLSYDKPEPLVELLEWNQVKSILRTGVNIEVLDIRTGLRYTVRSFSNGLHADVEPVTQEDAATLRRTFNNSWSWDGRPVWVTINGRTIAAAINGMPHGGGVISNNGVTGHFCLHFRGSRAHNGNARYTQQMQNAVTQAYNAAQQ